MILIVGSISLLVAYTLLLLLYAYGWQCQEYFTVDESFVPRTKISVVIAARNEAENIEKCIRSIVAQDYPAHLFEIIVVDDFSTDLTVAKIRGIGAGNLRLISLSDHILQGEKIIAFKKKALSVAIAQSSGDLIVATDADCWMQMEWLLTLAAFYQKNQAEMIVAPVRFSNNHSLLQSFQSLDFSTMQGITAATVGLDLGVMCNGANLAFSRKAYNTVKGYEGVDHLVSGDDYLLQLKIKAAYPDGVRYLQSKEAIVDTLPQLSWQGFLQQRIRWASKTGKYDDHKMTAILLLVYLFNCSVLALFCAAMLNRGYFMVLAVILCIKIIAEWLFLYPVARFFGNKRQLLVFPFLQPIHILYIVLAGFLSRVAHFNWKQRKNVQGAIKKYTPHA